MDKKEMQNWIDYLNNGGNALDMFDELERKAEDKRREKESFRLTLKEGGIGIEEIPMEYRDTEAYIIAFGLAKDVFEKKHVAKVMNADIDELADNGQIEEARQLEDLKRAIFGVVTLQEDETPEVKPANEFEDEAAYEMSENADISEEETPDEFDDSFDDYDDEENGIYQHPEDCRKHNSAHNNSDDFDDDDYEDFNQQVLVDGKKQKKEPKNTHKDAGEVEEIKPNFKKVIVAAMAIAGIVVLFSRKRKNKKRGRKNAAKAENNYCSSAIMKPKQFPTRGRIANIMARRTTPKWDLPTYSASSSS